MFVFINAKLISFFHPHESFQEWLQPLTRLKYFLKTYIGILPYASCKSTTLMSQSLNCFVTKKPLTEIQSAFYKRVQEDKTLDILMTHDEVQMAVRHSAWQLNEHFKNVTEPVHIVCLLSGVVIYLSDVAKYLNFRYVLHFAKATSYHGQEQKDIQLEGFPVDELKKHKHVVLMDELVDTGATIDACLKLIPHAIVASALAKKKFDGICGCDIIPKAWLVGYGLDDNGEKRGWPHLFAKNDKEWFTSQDRAKFREELHNFLEKINSKLAKM